jgi:hypothetical protein
MRGCWIAALVAVFTHGLPSAAAQQWDLSRRPVLRIGEVDAANEYMFTAPRSVARLSDGRIIVADKADLRYYDAKGKYLRTATREGRGPGEVAAIVQAHVLPGDSVIVWDALRKKLWFKPDMTLAREERVDLSKLPARSGFFSEGPRLLPNGAVLATYYEQLPSTTRPLSRLKTAFALFDPVTTRQVDLGVYLGSRQMTFDRRAIVQPFTPDVHLAVGTDRIYVGDTDSTLISAFDSRGNRVGIIRLAAEARPVRRGDLRAYYKWRLPFAESLGRAEHYERGFAAIQKPVRFPYFGELMTDRLGHLWVSSYTWKPQSESTWSVYDRNGKRITQIRMPNGFRPVDAGRDYVLGIHTDEDDVQQVQQYRLTRR